MPRGSGEAHDRLRLIHAATPKRVLSNLPLDLTVDEVVRLGSIVPDQETCVAMRHGVLPLAKTDLHRFAPNLFATADEVKHWLSRRGPGNEANHYIESNIAISPITDPSRVT